MVGRPKSACLDSAQGLRRSNEAVVGKKPLYAKVRVPHGRRQPRKGYFAFNSAMIKVTFDKETYDFTKLLVVRFCG